MIYKIQARLVCMNDPHHCRCFSIHSKDIEEFRIQLEERGFVDEFQEDHGQVFGRILRVEDKLQLHIKVMPDGSIEGEMEPPPAYPGAHLNPVHSYSAHKEIHEVLTQFVNVPSYVQRDVPSTCKNPIIKKPDNPTHAKTIAAVGLAGVGIAALLHYLSKDDEEDEEE